MGVLVDLGIGAASVMERLQCATANGAGHPREDSDYVRKRPTADVVPI